MIKKAMLILGMLIISQHVKAQKIFFAKETWKPGIKVFVVDQPYKADLLVYNVSFSWETKGNFFEGLWLPVKNYTEADHMVILVEHLWQANLTIYYCKHKYEAGWRSTKPKIKLD